MQSYTATVNGDYAVEITFGSCVNTSARENITGVGIKEIDDLILITEDFKKFNQGLVNALTEEGQQAKETRLEVITNHSWLKRTEKMLEIINKI